MIKLQATSVLFLAFGSPLWSAPGLEPDFTLFQDEIRSLDEFAEKTSFHGHSETLTAENIRVLAGIRRGQRRAFSTGIATSPAEEGDNNKIIKIINPNRTKHW